jgi:hypothetical protein
MTSPTIRKTIFDEALPQIGELLDRPRMRVAFEREVGCQVEDCHIVRAKLRPGRNCLIRYRLNVVDPNTGETHKQLLSLVAFTKGQSHKRFNLAQQQLLVSTAIGSAVFHLPELDAVVWAFPNDRKLTGLPAITDSTKLQELLPEVIADSFGEDWEIAALSSEVVSYAAERACTVRANLELSDSGTGETLRQMLFGKTYCSGEGEAIWMLMWRLWQQAPLLVPRPLSFQPEINTLWQQGLTGKTLAAFNFEHQELRGCLEKAGMAVAELHRLKLLDLPLREAIHPLAKLPAAESLLALAVPACQSKLRSLVRQLTNAFEKSQSRPQAILHGDLHLKNFFATGSKIVLIDWDNVCQGDPLQEIGSFAASLHYRGLLEEHSVQTSKGLIDSFVEAYRATTEGEFSASILNWQTAAALIYERAYRHVTRLNTNAPRVVEDLIELACRLTEKL